jgi:hypothetical protein
MGKISKQFKEALHTAEFELEKTDICPLFLLTFKQRNIHTIFLFSTYRCRERKKNKLLFYHIKNCQ